MKENAPSNGPAVLARVLGLLSPLLVMGTFTPGCFLVPADDLDETTESSEDETDEVDEAPVDSDFAFGSVLELSMHGGSGGVVTHDACAPGEVMVGLRGMLDERGWHGRMQAGCSRLELVQVMDGSHVVSTTQWNDTPLRGEVGQLPWQSECPENELVVGFDVRAGALVDQVEVACAPFEVIESPDGLFLIRGDVHYLEAVGGNGGSSHAERCPEGTVATVLDLRAGDSIDALGMSCRSLDVASN